MVRGCEDKPTFLNQIIEDGTYRYYYRSCQEDLCNDGTGYATGNTALQDQDIGKTIYTQGMGGATSVKINSFLLTVISFVVYYQL